MADAFPASPWSANSTWYPGQAPDQPEQPTGDWTSVKGQDLPNGLTAPPGLPPPLLPGGLNLPSDLPHPQVLGPSMQLPPPQPQYPLSAFMPTPEAHAMAKAAAPSLGVEPMAPPDLSEFPEGEFAKGSKKSVNPMAADTGAYLRESLANAAVNKRIQMGVATPGDYAYWAARNVGGPVAATAALAPPAIASGMAQIPQQIVEGMQQINDPLQRASNPDVGIPLAANTAQLLAGSRVLGGAPEEGLTLGAGPSGRLPPKAPEQPVVPATPEEHVASITGREPPTVVRDKSVPYLAGSSTDGSTIYIDPRVPKQMDVGAPQPIDPAHPLAVHEGVEHELMTRGPPVPQGMTRLYRGETNVPESERRSIPDYVKETPEFQSTLAATGRWFSDNPAAAQYYVDKFGSPGNKVTYVDVPTRDVNSYLASNQSEAGKFSAQGRAGEEYFVPREIADKRQPLPSYETAHRVALGEERKVVEQMGGDWATYQDQMHKLAETTEKEPAKNLPPDLYAKPYAHTDLYPKVKAADKSAETIRNAAIRYKGNVYEAPNHVLAGDKAHDALGFTPIGPDGAEDGFVTSQGRFVDRAEANKIAGGADQLRPDRADRFKPGLMRAEDLAPTAAPAVTEGIAAGKKGLAETVQDQVDALRQNTAQAGSTSPQPPGQSPPPSPPHGGGGPSLPARPTAQFVRSMEDRLHTINTKDAGRREMLRRQLDLTKGFTDEMGRNIQDARERGRVDTLTPEEQGFNRSWIDPLHERTTASKNVIRRINGEQSGVEPEELNDPNYMHRSLIGKTPGMDEASGLGDVVGYSGRRRMSTSPPSLRGRSIFAMEDEAGNRKVVTAYPGGDGVYSWGNGKFKVEPGSFIRTRPGEEIPGKKIPGRTTLERPVPARVTKEGGLSKAYYKKPKQIPDRITFDKETPPELLNDYFRPGSEFVDMNNKRWFMKQATTREIHDAGVRSSEPETYQDAEGNTRFRAGPPLRFYDNALVNEIVDHLNTEKARDTAETLREFRNEPEFKRYSVRSDLATPEQKRDMVPITAPGFEGRLFDRLYADPLNDYLNGAGWRIPYLDRMSNWVTKWMFKTGIGSLAHLRNEFWQRYQARGFGNLNAVARYKTFWQAMDETRNQGPIWQDYRNRGASFPSDRMHWNSLEQQILKTMGAKLADDPGMKGFFQRLGVTNHEGANMLEYGIGKAVFEIGDFMALQHGLELERRGFTRDQAIARMNRTLPTYRMPSRVGTQGALGRGVSKVLATPSTVQFGRFEYAKFKGLSSIVEDMLGSKIAGRLDKDERLDAIGRAAAIAVAVGVIGPFLINPIARGVTGDPNAHYLYGGSIGMLARFLREADNVVTGKKNLIDGLMGMADVTNIAPTLKELAAQPFNADPYTGRPITGKGVGWGTALFERLGHAAPSVFNPAEAIQRPGQYFLGGPSGVSTAKPYTPIVTRRDLINNMKIYGKTPGSGLMGTIGRFVHPGKYVGTSE